jgi:hypothetical protein
MRHESRVECGRPRNRRSRHSARNVRTAPRIRRRPRRRETWRPAVSFLCRPPASAPAPAAHPLVPAAMAQFGGRPAPDTAAKADTGPKILSLDNYGPWSRITNAAISPDGAWMVHTLQPNDGDMTITVRQLDGDKVHTIQAGAAPQQGAQGGGGFGGGGQQAAVLQQFPLAGYYVNPPSARFSAPRGDQGPSAQRPERRLLRGAPAPVRAARLTSARSPFPMRRASGSRTTPSGWPSAPTGRRVIPRATAPI